LHRHQPARRIEQTAGEHRVADDFVVLLRHQRESLAVRDGSAKVVDQIRDDASVLAERCQMHGPDTLSVALAFESNAHDASVVSGIYGSP
jgi:hypothetical protein